MELQLQHHPFNEYSGLVSFKIDFFWSPYCPRGSQESSPTPQFKSINSLVLSHLYGPRDYYYLRIRIILIVLFELLQDIQAPK